MDYFNIFFALILDYSVIHHFRIAHNTALSSTGHFRVPPSLFFKKEGSCSAFDMEIIFHSHANKTHFHKKGCAPSLILKVRVFGTQKWPISHGTIVIHRVN